MHPFQSPALTPLLQLEAYFRAPDSSYRIGEGNGWWPSRSRSGIGTETACGPRGSLESAPFGWEKIRTMVNARLTLSFGWRLQSRVWSKLAWSTILRIPRYTDARQAIIVEWKLSDVPECACTAPYPCQHWGPFVPERWWSSVVEGWWGCLRVLARKCLPEWVRLIVGRVRSGRFQGQ